MIKERMNVNGKSAMVLTLLENNNKFLNEESFARIAKQIRDHIKTIDFDLYYHKLVIDNCNFATAYCETVNGAKFEIVYEVTVHEAKFLLAR